MKLEWMGRYRDLVSALVMHGNVATRAQDLTAEVADGIRLKSQQWEVLEYIAEHPDETLSMVEISYRLCIPTSTFSKTVKLLCSYGLVEKYQTVNNRKNIILRPTDYGRTVYESFSKARVLPDLQGFFDELKDVSDSDLAAFVRAIEALDNAILPERKQEEVLLRRLPGKAPPR